MKIKIDHREKKLIDILTTIVKDNKLNIKIAVENLPIGDIIIVDEEKELLIIERKTLQDLASSIRDGRYKEQSFRLDAHPLHNHHIVYLIEGNMNSTNRYSRYTKIKPSTLLTCMFSLNYFKGFTVVQTNGIVNTAEYIVRIFDKIKREKGKKKAYYDEKKTQDLQHYNTVIKKEKKEFITPENISEIILSQIPSVSEKTARAVMSHFISFIHLIDSLRLNDGCLDGITFQTTGGRARRISKRSIANIKKFLLFQKIIKVET